MGSIMVAGGAGYIGSHCLRLLRERGFDAYAYDNLATGRREAVLDAPLVVGDLADGDKVERTLRERKTSAVFHFAASCYVGVSVTDPESYWRNNVATTLTLLSAMRRADVKTFIFSSTCATYGDPVQELMDESHPQKPINPYGWTKFAVERMLADFHRAYGLRYVALRYFNAAGAHPDARIGEDHDPETHLIPLVLQTAAGVRKEIQVFGDDYPTPDGTCIRDYIHILDLSSAHLLGLKHLEEGGESGAFNLGNGAGYSVLEVIRTAEAVTGKKVPYRIAPRRAGDPARLVGDASRAKATLGWKQEFGDLRTIVESAWRWHRAPAYGPHRR
ncbi:MAG TPA: UDP-glucose 4-epimerase GalE [Planctomycetota bacterium]|nr:UDP-glucose 4-epimerase GalE [Planctomycetota bacterium]